MTSSSGECKSCLDKYKISQQEIKKIIADMDTEKFEFVEEDIYEFRLKKCQQCSYLQDNITCLQDGDLVQIKAKLAGKNCSFPGQDKWND